MDYLTDQSNTMWEGKAKEEAVIFSWFICNDALRFPCKRFCLVPLSTFSNTYCKFIIHAIFFTFLRYGYLTLKFRKLQLLRSSNDIQKFSVAITCKNVIEYL